MEINLDILKSNLLNKLKEAPLNENVICKLASVLMEQGNFEETFSLLKKAVDTTRSVQVLNNLAYLYLNEGIYKNGRWYNGDDEAIKLLLEATSLKPCSHFPYSMLGEAYLKKNENTKAINALEYAIRLKSTLVNLNNMGVALYKLGQYNEASSYFLKAHSLRSKRSNTFIPYFSYAICLAQIGMGKHANDIANFLFESEELDFKGDVSYTDIARIYFLCKDYDKAKKVFEMASKEYILSSNEFGLYEYTLIQLSLIDEATKLYDETINFIKDNLNDTYSENEIDEDNRNALIKSLESELEQTSNLHIQIINGLTPNLNFEPQILEECYLFGCIRHNNGYYNKIR